MKIEVGHWYMLNNGRTMHVKSCDNWWHDSYRYMCSDGLLRNEQGQTYLGSLDPEDSFYCVNWSDHK